MSSISSFGGASQALYPLAITSSNNDPVLSGSNSIVATPGTQSGANPITGDTLLGGSGTQGTSADLFQQIQQSVLGALQSAGSNSSSNPNQIIQQAITNLLQQNASTSSSDPDSDGDSDAAGSTESGTASASSPQDFFQTLQSYGVDAQQFHSDFLSAINTAQQTGQVDASSVFASFPPGLAVDTTA
jgi:hypothetical protein